MNALLYLGFELQELEALRYFLRGLIDERRFFSNPWTRRRFNDLVQFAERRDVV